MCGTLDVDRMGTMGYTSKGENHGYGLSLAKEILKKNKNIHTEMSVYMNIVTQIVKIKMKEIFFLHFLYIDLFNKTFWHFWFVND